MSTIARTPLTYKADLWDGPASRAPMSVLLLACFRSHETGALVAVGEMSGIWTFADQDEPEIAAHLRHRFFVDSCGPI